MQVDGLQMQSCCCRSFGASAPLCDNIFRCPIPFRCQWAVGSGSFGRVLSTDDAVCYDDIH